MLWELTAAMTEFGHADDILKQPLPIAYTRSVVIKHGLMLQSNLAQHTQSSLTAGAALCTILCKVKLQMTILLQAYIKVCFGVADGPAGGGLGDLYLGMLY